MHHTIEEKVEIHKAFYQRKNERPILGFFIGSEYPLKRYQSMSTLPEGRPLLPSDFDIDAFIEDCVVLHKLHSEFGGDAIYSASAFWGIPWMEAFLGMELFASHDSGSIYAKRPNGYTLSPQKKFDPNNEWAVLCKGMLEKLAKTLPGEFPLATTRVRGVSDLLAIIYGDEEFIFEMYENEEEVKATAKYLTELITDFSKFQLKYIPEFHGGIGSFYYYLWAPKGTVWLQEDATALLSPTLYNDFIKDCDKQLADVFNGCIMHQHPDGYIPYKELLELDYSALELHVDTGGKSAAELNDIHHEILAKKPLCIWGELSENDLDVIFTQLPCEGLAVMCMVENEHQSADIYNKYIQKR